MTFQNPNRRAAPLAIGADASANTERTEVNAFTLRIAPPVTLPTPDELNRLGDIATATHVALLQAEPVTPRDLAIQVLSFREYLEGNGPLPDHLVNTLERTARIA